MIPEYIFLGFLEVVKWFVNKLPLANNDFTTKYESLIDWIYTHVLTLSHYYLPMTSINWWLHQSITFVLAVIGLRLLADLISGIIHIRLPWAK